MMKVVLSSYVTRKLRFRDSYFPGRQEMNENLEFFFFQGLLGTKLLCD